MQKKILNPNVKRDQMICELRKQGWTLAKIAGKYSLSDERVRQICLNSKAKTNKK